MRGTLRGSCLAGVALLTSACAAAHPAQKFRPEGSSQNQGSDTAATSAPSRTGAHGLAWPPFGSNLHVTMPGWLPAKRSQIPAVVADKNFALALLYAEYRGNRDHRWQAYTSPRIRSALARQLSAPDVTTESFTGTIRFSHLSAFPDSSIKGAIDVAQCFDNSHSTNTSLQTGQPVSDKTPANQHYYLTTNVLKQSSDGKWRVVSIYPAIYYPQARECKP
ncbi:MAG: hypothetical protein J2P33_14780 [Actinobacteria bacterium]|nr:hypothetical protein [Actinomycetota bacterium]